MGANADPANARDLADDPCRQAAGAIALWAACGPAAAPARCGVCRDPDGKRNEALMWRWLQAWREGSFPSDCAVQEFGIFVEGLPGVRQLQVQSGTLVEELHQRLAELAGQPVDSFYLLAGGHRLSAKKSLGASGIARDCTVRAQGRLRGGVASLRGPPPEEDRPAELTAYLDALHAELFRDRLRSAGAGSSGGPQTRGAAGESSRRVGGRPARAQQGRSAAQLAAEALITPVAGPRGFECLDDPLEVEEQVRDYTCDKLTGRLAESTAVGYQREWEQWLWVCRCRGAAPLLMATSAAGKLDEEDRVLAYLGYLGWLGKPGSALRSATLAIQAGHRRAAAGDPIKDMDRVRLLVERLTQESTLKPRRLGVTPGMLRWLRARLRPRWKPRRGAKAEDGDRTMQWAAVTVAWFFLLRAGEYCNSGKVDQGRILRGLDVSLKDGGELCGPGEADQVDLQFRKSKTDQEAFGATRTHFANYKACSGVRLCPVEALEMLRSWQPGRFGTGPEAGLPLFRWANGVVLHRTQVQQLLQEAAAACGLPAGRFMTHSLRIGGASALFHATNEIEVVKRCGRCQSGALHGYLWNAAEQSKGMAEGMATAEATIHYT